jgi:ubiquinone/menaquinone biosynthesis C-methylase UbiE
VEDAGNLSFENASFDTVVSQNVFHHIPQWEKTISEIYRVLKNNGYLFWADLAFPRILVRLLKNRVKNYGLYSIQDVKKRFTDVSFATVQYQKKLHGPMVLHQLILKKNK